MRPEQETCRPRRVLAPGWSGVGGSRFSIRSASGDLREYSIPLPEGTDNGDVVLSPGGNRLAWILYVRPEEYKDSARWLQSVQLAVSDIDGGRMRVIGTLPIEGDEDLYGRGRRLDWLPDGTRVSFNHDGSRWAVPVGQ